MNATDRTEKDVADFMGALTGNAPYFVPVYGCEFGVLAAIAPYVRTLVLSRPGSIVVCRPGHEFLFAPAECMTHDPLSTHSIGTKVIMPHVKGPQAPDGWVTVDVAKSAHLRLVQGCVPSNRKSTTLVAHAKRGGGHAVAECIRAHMKGSFVNWINWEPSARGIDLIGHEFHQGESDELVVNSEDWGPQKLLNFAKRHPEIKVVVVIRDLLNQLASKKREYPRLALGSKEFKAIAERHRATLEAYVRGDFTDFTVVDYNRFHHSEDYRKELIEGFGLEFTDAGRDDVSPIGGGPGSSFTGRRVKGSELDTFNRYRNFWVRPQFRKLVSDRDIELHHAAGLFTLDDHPFRVSE